MHNYKSPFPFTLLITATAIAASLAGCAEDGSRSSGGGKFDDADSASAETRTIANPIDGVSVDMDLAPVDDKGWLTDAELLGVRFTANPDYRYRVLISEVYTDVLAVAQPVRCTNKGPVPAGKEADIIVSADLTHELAELTRIDDDAVSVTALLSRPTTDVRLDLHIEAFKGDSLVQRWSRNFDPMQGLSKRDAFPAIVTKAADPAWLTLTEFDAGTQAAKSLLDLCFRTSEPTTATVELGPAGPFVTTSTQDDATTSHCFVFNAKDEGLFADVNRHTWRVRITDRTGNQTNYELFLADTDTEVDNQGLEFFSAQGPATVTVVD